MRDKIALWLIRLAQKATTHGDTYGQLQEAERCQVMVVMYNALPDFEADD